MLLESAPQHKTYHPHLPLPFFWQNPCGPWECKSENPRAFSLIFPGGVMEFDLRTTTNVVWHDLKLSNLVFLMQLFWKSVWHHIQTKIAHIYYLTVPWVRSPGTASLVLCTAYHKTAVKVLAGTHFSSKGLTMEESTAMLIQVWGTIHFLATAMTEEPAFLPAVTWRSPPHLFPRGCPEFLAVSCISFGLFQHGCLYHQTSKENLSS